jgi:cytochrome P450
MKFILTLLLLISCSDIFVKAEVSSAQQGSSFIVYSVVSTLVLLGVVLVAFVYTFVVKPYFLVRFYRNQGIPMQYSPVIGSFSQDLQNAEEKGDYYHDWIQLAKQNPRPKAMGKNVAQDAQLYLIDPEAIKQFFLNHQDYIKHPFLNALTKELGKNNLIMAEGRVWKDHRKIMSTGFHFDVLRDLLPDVVKHSLEIIEGYRSKDLKNFYAIDEFRDIAGEVIGRVFFDESLSESKMKGQPVTIFLANLIAKVSSEPYEPLYLMFGMNIVNTKLIPRQREMLQDIRDFRNWCEGIVRRNMTKRREDYKKGLYPYKDRRQNMFDVFFNHELANPEEALSEEELIDEFITFFSDGVYTTGHFISMCSYYLEKNPEWKQKVIDEMETLFPDLSDITHEGIQKMDVLALCMKETLRLSPPVATAVERIALHDHELAGIKIKKDTTLMACHPANHLDERFFEDPLVYNPERWTKPSLSQESVKAFPSLFIPFSMGPRRCIGQNFAMNEAKVILTILMRKFRYDIADKNYTLRFTQRFLREPLEPIVYKLTPCEISS